ncbi:hypothetical protein [Metallosphaera tengchongensis]|uniref:hypothetical protein n=1 Tax=Metallosphaera tengchongensis TaxID=1532350 RepID=UPI001FE805C7|nr:hypothetical protein [Metallosphaera tengchongensis]
MDFVGTWDRFYQKYKEVLGSANAQAVTGGQRGLFSFFSWRIRTVYRNSSCLTTGVLKRREEEVNPSSWQDPYG